MLRAARGCCLSWVSCRPSWRLCQARMVLCAMFTVGRCLSAGMPSCEVTCPSGRELQRLPDSSAHHMCSSAGIHSKGKRQTEASALITLFSLHSSVHADCSGQATNVMCAARTFPTESASLTAASATSACALRHRLMSKDELTGIRNMSMA